MDRVYGLVGFPLGHSFSKRYFTEKFEKLGVHAEYLNFEIENIESIHKILAEQPHLTGLNITIPHKTHIIPFLTDISEEAKAIGAVNCVRVEHSDNCVKLYGYNTDAVGFETALRNFMSDIPEKALVLGNGGAAKAVKYVLGKMGINVLTVSRSPKCSDEISYEQSDALIPDCKLIVNTTPLGMWPKCESAPNISYSKLTPKHYLFDLVYNPEVTTFMKLGMEQSAKVCNGYQMLVEQAEAGWKIWNQSRK